jgi:hypothetical protein
VLSAAHHQPVQADLAPIETELRVSWRRRTTIRLSAEDIRVDGERIALSSITAVGYAATERAMNVTQHGMVRHVMLETPQRCHQLQLGCSVPGAADDPSEQTYLALVELLHHRVEPRLRARIVSTVLGGQPSQVGGLVLHRGGIDIERRWRAPLTVGWSEVPCAMLEAHHVVVRRAASTAIVARRSALESNGVLLPELVESLIAELA